MKNILLSIMAILCATSLMAQSNPAVKGRVVDATTGAAIEYADVIITDAENNTIAPTSPSTACATESLF